jgi:plastocyanin
MGLALLIVSSILANARTGSAGVVCQPTDEHIGMTGSTFTPSTVTIEPDETVCFENTSAVPHTVKPTDAGSFEGSNGSIPAGDGFRRAFPAPGSYAFYCEFHGGPTFGMRGSITVTEPDVTPPAPPSNLASDPSSPANENDPKIKGTAEAGSTVQLYTDDACDVAVGSPASRSTFADPGIGVHVDDNTSTTFYATAKDDADNVSDCSTDSVTYVEDSSDVTGPTVVLTSQPKKRTTKRTATLTFVPEAGASYFCKLDRRGLKPCSDGTRTYTHLEPTKHTFTVYGVDEFANPGPTLTYSWRILPG